MTPNSFGIHIPKLAVVTANHSPANGALKMIKSKHKARKAAPSKESPQIEPSRSLRLTENGYAEIVLQDQSGNEHAEIVDIINLYREMIVEPVREFESPTNAYQDVLQRHFAFKPSVRLSGEVFTRLEAMVEEIEKKDIYFRRFEIAPNSGSEHSTNDNSQPGSSKPLTPTARQFCEPNESLPG